MTTLVKRTDVSSNATAVHFSTACEWWFEFTVHLFCFTHYMETNSDSSLGQSKNKIQPHCHFDLLNYCPSFSLLWVTGEVFCGHCYCWLDFSSSGKIYLGRRTLLLNCEYLFVWKMIYPCHMSIQNSDISFLSHCIISCEEEKSLKISTVSFCINSASWLL